MEIPMLLPRPQDNSAHLVLLGKYKVTRGKKKNLKDCISYLLMHCQVAFQISNYTTQ